MGGSTPRRRIRPVRQERSRRTLAALLDGLDRLLRDRPFESITVLDLAREANVSTGAFYARFASKEDLLPELYLRFQESLDDTAEHELQPSSWESQSADDRLARLAGYLCETYESRSWLLRAVAVHSRRHHGDASPPDEPIAAQVKWLRRLAACLDAPPSPWSGVQREAVEFAVYAAAALAREAILFPHLPMTSALRLNARSIRPRLVTLMRNQLSRKGTT